MNGPVLTGLLLLAAMGPPSRGGGMMGMAGMRELMSWFGGAELSGAPTQPRPKEDHALRAAGARVYAERCTPCHGERGDGQGREAGRLSVPPRDFTAGVYKLRSTASGSLPTDEDLFRTISRGMHGTAMLPWPMLSESERWALVAHLKSLSPRFSRERPAPTVAVPPPPPETPERAQRGREAYERAGCPQCHGPQGHGDGPAAGDLRDDLGRPRPPRDFTSRRFLRGSRMEDLYLTLRTGLDGSPMSSFESALSPDETWAIAAYIRSLLPAGPSTPGGMSHGMMGSGGDPEERLGMRIDLHGGMGGRMGGPMH